MKKIILFFAFSCLFASENDSLFLKAIEKYDEGKFDTALLYFLKVYEKQPHNFKVLYNIGNCYYRLGFTANAILFYEKARKINPADKDVNANIEFLKSKLTDVFEELPIPFTIKAKNYLIKISPPGIWNLIAITSAIIIAILLLIIRFIEKFKTISIYLTIITGVFLIISISINILIWIEKEKKEGIIIKKPIEIMSAPGSGILILKLQGDGIKVSIIDSTAQWYKVLLPNLQEGWVKKEFIEII